MNDAIAFEWDEANETKLLIRHGVSVLEAEQCFINGASVRRRGDAYLALGRTNDGRMLFLVFERKDASVIRIYSAREMTPSERRAFRQDR